MNIINNKTCPSLPTEMWAQPPCTLDFPFSFEVLDEQYTVGSGVGTSTEAIQAGLGEYFERRHFYQEITKDFCSSLNENLKPSEVVKFTKAFKQTTLADLEAKDLGNRKLHMTSVVRISDLSSCSIPTICISLTHNPDTDDDDIYPRRDTCGCSFHKNFESAIFGAIKESLERQFLSRFWLTKRCSQLIEPTQAFNLIRGSSAFGLYRALSKSGELSIIDISDQDFPGTCVLTIYGSDALNKNVRYCAGMSYAKNRATAIEKSILELWQTFRFMNLFQVLGRNPDSLQDSYIRHFMNCNSYEVYQEIIGNIEVSPNPNQQEGFEFNSQTLIEALSDNEIEGYLYLRPITIAASEYMLCRFVSPSLFMHMDNSKYINIDNDYSKRFTTTIDITRKQKMVPFP